VVAVLVVVLAVAPPLSSWARHYDVAEAVQFGLLALVLPILLTLGAPFHRVRPGQGVVADLLDTAVSARHGRRSLSATLPALVAYLAMLIVWRTPYAVEHVAHTPTLVVAEAAVFVLTGVAFFSELVASAPLSPRVNGARRIALCIPPMWTVWVLAYLLAFANATWFPTLHNGPALSLLADQQFAAGVLWAMSTCVFLPLIFLNLVRFLSDEEDLDYELDRIVRAERRARSPWRSVPTRQDGRADRRAPRRR
jgi:cytochrome c oxidase assembly factor CtaG